MERTVKTYVGLVRDHSGSMSSLRVGATNDYNLTLSGIKESIADQTAVVSVVECGVGYRGEVKRAEVLQPINQLKPITSYSTSGGATPLFDSVGEVISIMENVSDRSVLGVAFLVMVITDGYENASKLWTASKLKDKISALQGTDKWTFVFRVPRGLKASLMKLGIPEGNIMEWEQTEQALVQSTTAHVSGIKNYFTARASGATHQKTFYTNLQNVSVGEVKANLIDISKEVSMLRVGLSNGGEQIRDFCKKIMGEYKSGHAHYQLTKSEIVQDYKRICIRDKNSGKIYGGVSARTMLGLPTSGNIRLAPGNHGQYDLFVQSNSVNRKLVGDTWLLYWR